MSEVDGFVTARVRVPVSDTQPDMSCLEARCMIPSQREMAQTRRQALRRIGLRTVLDSNGGTRTVCGLLLLLCFGCQKAENSQKPVASTQPAQPLCLHPVLVNEAWGYIDSSGRIRIEPRFEDADWFFEGLARVGVDGRYGFIDQTGRVVIPLTFEPPVGPFAGGYAPFRDPNTRKWGYIDTAGRTAIEPRFDHPARFREGLALVRVGEKSGCIDSKGNMAIPAKFDDIGDRSEGLIAAGVRQPGSGDKGGIKYGYIDKTGTFVIQPQFDEALEFAEGRAFVVRGAEVYCIDRSGTTLFKVPGVSGGLYFEGLAKISILQNGSELIGFIDTNGKIVIEPQFTMAFAFSEGLVAVRDKEGWGFIDKTGKWVIEPVFSSAESFRGQLAWVETPERKGYINHDGKWVWSQVKDTAAKQSETIPAMK